MQIIQTNNTTPHTHLCEALLEVVVEDVRLFGHYRKGDVVSHAERALLPALGHVGNLLSNKNVIFFDIFSISSRP